MTGIAAIFATGPVRPEQLDRMMSAMHERVRDDSGTWTSGAFGLGAVVLHTTTESFEAAQPLASADGSLVLAMDGYLTNWEELRSDLLARGAVLRNRSDGELVLHAYDQWGEVCASRLEGEFALVLADRRRQRIYAARDHQGLRPLYIYEDEGALLIASDMAAIIAAATRKPEADFDYLANIVSGHWYLRDRTVWKGLGRVPPAHWLAQDPQGRTLHRYYTVPCDIDLSYRREEDYVDHYREVLFDAVRRTSRSHVPLAMTVSGGLDSSSVYCIAHELEKLGRLPAPGLQGYTLAGEPGTPAYELPYARSAADHCGRNLIEVPLFRPGIDWFTARGAADCDVPLPQNGAMSFALERRAHAEGARTLMGGLGGDQWLDGTREYYTEFARAFEFAGFSRALARDARANGWRPTLPEAMRFGVSAFVPMALRRAKRRRLREQHYHDPAELFWMRPEWRDRLLAFEEDYLAGLPEQSRPQGNWNRLLSPYNAFAMDFMQRQRGVSGVETREPMLTRQFIAFCARAPKWVLRQGALTKVVHRKAMRGIMPDLIVDRTDKAEFSDPAIRREFARLALSQSPGVLDPLCDHAGMRKLTNSSGPLGVDPERGWEVWGCYAVAAFLALGH